MASVPWEQSVHFLAASNIDVLPGGATSYGQSIINIKQNQGSTNHLKVYPRRIGNSPQDVTSFHPGQALWSKQELPDIFYILKPSKEWKKHAFSKRPDKKRDQAGNVMLELEPDEGQQPRALLDFKILPDKIGTNEEYVCICSDKTTSMLTSIKVFFELWRRLDGRIRWGVSTEKLHCSIMLSFKQDILMRMERTNRPKGNAINVSSRCSISNLKLT